MSAILSVASPQVHSVWIELPHGFWYWLIVGLIGGWLAGKISRGRGFGCIADIILGIVGSFIGGWIFVKLHIYGGGFWYSLAAATVGAVVLVFIAHLFSPGDR
ncbi:MAG: GlsB/YeaQ/YmgE family stress response membrane protein [Chthoniobacterales bacterium]